MEQVRLGQKANLAPVELAQLIIALLDQLILDCRYAHFDLSDIPNLIKPFHYLAGHRPLTTPFHETRFCDWASCSSKHILASAISLKVNLFLDDNA